MLLPFEWLKEFIEIGETPEEIAHLLTMSGTEVESMEGVSDQTILEVNITPNRADCLSILGIARELSAILGRPLKHHNTTVSDETSKGDTYVEILDPDLCGRYTGRIIRNITVGDSPSWIKKRIEASGFRSVNNIVDITNYVLMEYGHPLHAFDLNTLQGNTIRIKRAEKDGKITTLDGVERNLPEDSLLIWDSERPIAVAGVMGGLETEVTEHTEDIFLESAWFSPPSVRKTSKSINLKSESSYRFERGTDIIGLEKALNRASLLIAELCGGEISHMIDISPLQYSPVKVSLDAEHVKRLLGVAISESEMEHIFRRLGFEYNRQGRTFTVPPPPYRNDIEQEADLIEELARVYGYDRIPSVMPGITMSATLDTKSLDLLDTLKGTMRQSGFTEVINYSFLSDQAFSLYNIPEGDKRRNALRLKNPINREESLMRTFLTGSLVDNMKYNLNHGVTDINLYEVATVCFRRGNTLPEEHLKLASLACHEKRNILYRETADPFYRLKGVVEEILQMMRVSGCSFRPSQEPFLFEGQSADIFLPSEGAKKEMTKVGYVGILSPEVVLKLDLRLIEPKVTVFELFLKPLLEAQPLPPRYRGIPKYPSIERDFAIIVNEDLPAGEIIDLIRSYPDELIESVSIFDAYSGKTIPEGKKSLAFHITYRSMEKTLKDHEADTLHTRIVGHVTGRVGGTLR